jgi:NTE family protein
MKTQCFAIFEGGGAKGLAHVGALKAAEARDLEFIGIAGASAGAIIAALVAAGFKADELYCPEPQRRASSLFGTLDWTSLLDKRRWGTFLELQRDFAALRGTPGVCTAYKAWRFKRRWMTELSRVFELKGFFLTDGFEAWLNNTLVQRLRLPSGNVTFGHLYEKTGKILKLVAVDVREKELVVYSNQHFENMPVARAVAASISIPFFFVPKDINGRSMVDGGLMSNFPAWLFEAERDELPPFIRTYGFTLVEAAAHVAAGRDLFDSLIEYAGLVVQAGVYGSQTLLNETVEFCHVLPITTRFGVLDFALSDEKKDALYGEGLNCANHFFQYRRVVDPAAVTAALKVLSEQLRALLGQELPNLRANIILPLSKDYLRVTYTYNMEDDADDRLRLKRNQTGTGDAWNEKRPIKTDMRQVRNGRVMRGLSKYDSALVRGDIVSLISVPVFRAEHDWEKLPHMRASPTAVLAFDCPEDILGEFERPEMSVFFQQSSILIGRLMHSEPLVEEVRMTIPLPEVPEVASQQPWQATGTLGNRMQERPKPAVFDNAFSEGLTGLGEKAVEAIRELGPEDGVQP